MANQLPMRFSISSFGTDDHVGACDNYALLFKAALFADKHDFEAIWISERHFCARNGLSPNPSVLCAALAARTKHLHLRASSVLVPLHHPVRVAEEWAMVDNLSRGRSGIACASGWDPRDFVFAPENYKQQREIALKNILIIERLWQGGRIRMRDGMANETELAIFPKPWQKSFPLWITAFSNPATFQSAGEIGAGILTSLMGQNIDQLNQNVLAYRKSFEEHKHATCRRNITVMIQTCLSEDDADAYDRAREAFERYVSGTKGLLQRFADSFDVGTNIASLSEPDKNRLVDRAYATYVKPNALIGKLHHSVALVEKLRSIGVNEICCLIDFSHGERLMIENLRGIDTLRQMCNTL